MTAAPTGPSPAEGPSPVAATPLQMPGARLTRTVIDGQVDAPIPLPDGTVVHLVVQPDDPGVRLDPSRLTLVTAAGAIHVYTSGDPRVGDQVKALVADGHDVEVRTVWTDTWAIARPDRHATVVDHRSEG